MSLYPDVEETSISTFKTSISLYPDHDIEESSISTFKTSISLYPYVEDFSISINAHSISVYDIEGFEALSFDIEWRVLRYRCFFASAAVARARYWTHIAVHTIHCASNVWPVAYAGSAPCRQVCSAEAASSVDEPPPPPGEAVAQPEGQTNYRGCNCTGISWRVELLNQHLQLTQCHPPPRLPHPRLLSLLAWTWRTKHEIVSPSRRGGPCTGRLHMLEGHPRSTCPWRQQCVGSPACSTDWKQHTSQGRPGAPLRNSISWFIKEECACADIIIDVGFHSDFVSVLHVLKCAELVEDVDAEVVDEGISIIGSCGCYIVYCGYNYRHCVDVISYTISNPIFFDMTIDIEREKGLRYRIQYHHTISKDICSISKRRNFDIDSPFRDLRYRLYVTFDVE